QPSPRAPAAAEAERDRILAEKSPDLKMLDADVVAVSPASVWRVLKQDGLLLRSKGKASRRRIGFEQPLQPHQAWHIDVSYINLFCAARTSMATHPPQRAGSMASGLLGLER